MPRPAVSGHHNGQQPGWAERSSSSRRTNRAIFNVPLAPGEYILHPETPEGMPLPFADEQHFTVSPGEFTRLVVSVR